MHPPRPPHKQLRRTRTAPAPDTSRPRGGLRRLLAAVAALASAVTLTVAVPAVGASAAPASAASAAVAKHTIATAKSAAKNDTAGSVHGSLKASHAAHTAPPSDVRQVCATPKRGYAACMSLQRTNVKAHKGLFPHATTPMGYGPSDLQSAYNLPSATAGSGQTVAIVDAYDDPNAEADLATYRTQYGLPACTTANGCFQKVNQDGQASPLPPAAGSVAGSAGWDEEESLDIDMVSAACPNCHILLIEANSNNDADMYAAEDEAVTLGAKYVSNSWAECEYPGETSDDQSFNHPGVAITAAGGDNGYDNYQQGCTSPNYPAASQYVTSVGGTTLNQAPGTSRGWTETVWSGTGSGCSQYEAKPSWQTDSGCAKRMTTDVSAVSDPNTGLAIYDSYSVGGWTEVGGTSAATPIIASAYALAGTPQAGTYPSSYPYLNATGLNDVTTGTNYDQSCTPAYLCTAAPGYDGPTGLGTPDGVSAFTPVQEGTLTGTVTDAATSQPIAGVMVTAGPSAGTTNSSGQYSIILPAGTYTMNASKFGYATKTATGVQVSQGQTTTQNFALAAAAKVTLSGTVTDGSGHGWPLPVKITVPGTPLTTYTSPFNGAYSLSLPDQATYKLHLTAAYPGYAVRNTAVQLGTSDAVDNITLRLVPSGCTAPGYSYAGAGTQFTGWAGITAQDGWSVTDDNGSRQTWAFDNPGAEGQPPGGDSSFAIADSRISSAFQESAMDTSLVSPVVNLSGVSKPVIAFDTSYLPSTRSQSAHVDLSLDGGKTWDTVWTRTVKAARGPVRISIRKAAGQADVRVRFHYSGNNNLWWSLDNVFIGSTTCTVDPGGLIAGTVTAAGSGAPLQGVTVTAQAAPGERATSSAAPADPALPHGFYSLFAAGIGSQEFTATGGGYAPENAAVNVAAGGVTHQDWALRAGHITVTGGSISATETLGQSTKAHITLTNTGTAPAQVSFTPASPGFTPTGGPLAQPRGAPLQRIKMKGGLTLPRIAATTRTAPAKPAPKGAAGPTPDGSAWSYTASYPYPIVYNGVAYDPGTGSVYSVGGESLYASALAASYVYHPVTRQWRPIASLPQPLDDPIAAFLGGQLYVAGGETSDLQPSAAVYVYSPSSDSWSQAASLPVGALAPAGAVLNGDLYVIGGCGVSSGLIGCSSESSRSVFRYDPARNTWTSLASYPTPVMWGACAGIDGEVVCSGGSDFEQGGVTKQYRATYIYHPATNTWSTGASLPSTDLAMGYAAANGKLQVFGGFVGGAFSNQGWQYDPVTNAWTPLPNLNIPLIWAAGSCGLYSVGGLTLDSGFFEGETVAEELPGYGRCGPVQVPWLSAGNSPYVVPPGQTVTVPVTLDSSKVSQPGTYTAGLVVGTDTPAQVRPVTITMTVKPPPAWGEVTGTVTSAVTGNPIAGSTVQIATDGGKGKTSYAATTDSNGHYQWWLDAKDDPLLISTARDGYLPQAQTASVSPGQTTTLNFALDPNPNPAGVKR